MKLVIVESTRKAVTLADQLGPDYVVRATSGHLRDLPAGRISNADPTFRLLPGKTKLLGELNREAALVSEIIIATDPDREGEAIAADLEAGLKKSRKPTRRARLDGLTGELDNHRGAGQIDKDLVESQKARRIIDRLHYQQLSDRLRSHFDGDSPAVGRVQAEVLDHLARFESPQHWSVRCRFETPDSGIWAVLETDKDLGPDQARALADALNGTSFEATTEATALEVKPDQPHNTASLLHRISDANGMDSGKAMDALQSLYSGIEMDSKRAGLISYPRTTARGLSTECRDQIEEFLKGWLGKDATLAPPGREGRTNQPGIFPLEIAATPKTLRPHLSPAQYRVYRTVWMQAVASQMEPARGTEFTTAFSREDVRLTARRVSITEPGHLKVSDSRPDQPNTPGDITGPITCHRSEVVAPDTRRGMAESGLLSFMANGGPGTPATYAATIAKLVDKSYVSRQSGRLELTRLGKRVADALGASCRDLIGPEVSARLTEDLEAIARGSASRFEIVRKYLLGD